MYAFLTNFIFLNGIVWAVLHSHSDPSQFFCTIRVLLSNEYTWGALKWIFTKLQLLQYSSRYCIFINAYGLDHIHHADPAFFVWYSKLNMYGTLNWIFTTKFQSDWSNIPPYIAFLLIGSNRWGYTHHSDFAHFCVEHVWCFKIIFYQIS